MQRDAWNINCTTLLKARASIEFVQMSKGRIGAMSLVYCPECGNEVSGSAVACPNCGRPLSAGVVTDPAVGDSAVHNIPVVERIEDPVTGRTVAARPVVERHVVTPGPVRTRETVPAWAIALMAILGVTVLGVLFYAFTNSDDSTNTNIRLNAGNRANSSRNVASAAPEDVRTTQVPATSAPVTSVPSTSAPAARVRESTTTNIPSTSTSSASAPAPTKGSVAIKASINTKTGETRAAKSVKFYLLDKDVEAILSDARIDPIEGNTLSGSMGLAMVYPERFGDFRRAAMAAMAPHVKYVGTTDTGGVAKLGNVDPNAYYLFSITRIGQGFALWNSPVSVTPGDNVLELSPQDVTEVRG